MQFLRKISPSSICSKNALFKGLCLGLIVLIGSLLFTAVFITSTIYQKYRIFLNTSALTHSETVELVSQARAEAPAPPTTFLILGVDEIENRPNHPQLTDTMMLLNISPDSGEIVALSLPRDLWNEPYKTKINALYEYGKERFPDSPGRFPQEVISNMTKQQIDHTIVVSLDQVAAIIDLLGCITVNVERGFVDYQFPRSDVDISTERDPAKLYETVEFKQGQQAMNSELALKYIRSRNSQDPEAGNDLARSQRQQQVIQAILEKLSNPRIFWYYPQLAGELVKFYQDEFANYYPLNKVLALGYTFASSRNHLELASSGLSVYPDSSEGVIEHPRNLSAYQQQWVYIIRDQIKFEQYIQEQFSFTKND